MRGATFVGEPCQQGHVLRYVKSGYCVECRREINKAYRAGERKTEGIPPEFAREAHKAKQAAALRLAEVRAQKTARQRRCLGIQE